MGVRVVNMWMGLNWLMTVAGFCKLVAETSAATGNLLFGQWLEDYPVPSRYPCRIDTLGMESVCSSETQISIFQTTIRCYNPVDLSMNVHRLQNKIYPFLTELLAGTHADVSCKTGSCQKSVVLVDMGAARTQFCTISHAKNWTPK
jgi:hypothetical protein